MCPDMFNMIQDMLFVFFLIIFIQMPILFYPWLLFGILCYFFAGRHSVFCGIPMCHKSRYEEWRDKKNGQ
jgi:hypothetical protein